MNAYLPWSLFLDETGVFSEPEEPAALAGLLLVGEGPGSRAELDSVVRAAWPGLLYPPHASELRRAAGALRGLMLGAGPGHPLVEEARATLPSEVLASLVAAGGRRARFDALLAAGARIAEHAALRARLDAYRQDGFDRLRAALAGLADRAFLVAAMVGPSSDPDVTAEQRYDAALTALLERVLLQLRGGGRAVIRTHVAQIHRRDGLPAPARRPIMQGDVARCARAAEAHPWHAEASDPLKKRVRLVAALPRPYDALVHPGVVLADFVANQMLVPLKHAPTIEQLRNEGLGRVRVDLSRLPDGLPEAGPLPFPTAPEPWGPTWIPEQAALWAKALEAGRSA